MTRHRTNQEIAEHEVAHALSNSLLIYKFLPDHVGEYAIECAIHKNGGHAQIFSKTGPQVPARARALSAIAPVLSKSFGSLRDAFRAKRLALDEDILSSADIDIVRAYSAVVDGHMLLEISDCEILVACARLINDEAVKDVGQALIDGGTLTLSADQWVIPSVAKRVLSEAGADFMKIHAGSLPSWAEAVVDRRFKEAA